MREVNETRGVYTLHQLEQLGHALAFRHHRPITGQRNQLLPELRKNENLLRHAHKLIVAIALEGQKSTPAADWLLDNFHVVEEQIAISKIHLPRRFSYQLPMVDDPVWNMQPRISILARELINHTDGRLDVAAVNAITTAYQSISPLKLGELWALPIMLRLGLIDGIRAISESISACFVDKRNARYWSDKMASAARDDPHNLIVKVSALATSDPRLSSDFVAEFARLVQANCPLPELPLRWVEQRLADHGLSIEQHQYLASQNQAHDQISMGNSIGSMRFIGETDWRSFVEGNSHVERTLCADPAATYEHMDFATRDAYRHVVEYCARYSDKDETEVAAVALEMAIHAAGSEIAVKPVHIGEYLLGAGRRELEHRLRVKKPTLDQMRNFLTSYPMFYYAGLLLILTALICWPIGRRLYWDGDKSALALGLLVLTFFPASQAAIAILNRFTNILMTPKPWPRMDYALGVPDSARTMVVVPSMLSSEVTIQALIHDLEIRYLGNSDRNILFALLTDFCDAPSQQMPDDAERIASAVAGIELLNAKYLHSESRRPFYLFHRPRVKNERDGVWMGYERKRGKIADLNGYLRGMGAERFSHVVGEKTLLPTVRYVITLDADSSLPRETARQLIATMSHPLNQPTLDAKTRVVIKGYAILQPRVAIYLTDTAASRFARLFSDDSSIDPYTKTVSDVYQDLFNEGSFIGKGIYDLDAFAKSLRDRFPENRILSHDLIEGSFARSGLISDIQLVERCPTTYLDDAYRRHRWIRGDWQIGSWIFPAVPGLDGGRHANPLSYLGRWKIFDNIRRCLNPIATLAAILLSGVIGPAQFAPVTLPLVIVFCVPHLLYAGSFKHWLHPISLRQALSETLSKFQRCLAIVFVSLTFLPHEAYVATDATIRSLYRLLVSRRKLLEWVASSTAPRNASETLLAYVKMMWISPLIAVVSFAGLLFRADTTQASLLVLSGCWLLAPLVAWWISQPVSPNPEKLTVSEANSLRILARKSWNFFETFVTPSDNWLPPDNFQEYPSPVIAHRTSPTNIGLALLSTMGAVEFGYLPLNIFIERISSTLSTMSKMPRYKDHFYNWYDTETLKALPPLYISTVDSGNLAGSLWVLAIGLQHMAESGSDPAKAAWGIEDVVSIIRSLSDDLTESRTALLQHLNSINEAMSHYRIRAGDSIESRTFELEMSLAAVQPMADALASLCSATPATELYKWIMVLQRQISEYRHYLQSLKAGVQQTERIRLQFLAAQALSLMSKDFGFLYNKRNRLLVIGYNVTEGRRDPGYYDLLASEARIASFVGIANGSLPQEHWFALGRQMVANEGNATLLSWSGSMFEYLMPLLIMPSFSGTILDQSCRNSVKRQIKYGRARGVPWGISESGYNSTDASLNYQYRAFGVPGLGIKRGLELDLVIAPYASALALMLEPVASCANLKTMERLGFHGEYGLYEAVDYTPSRLPLGVNAVVIKSYMAHHQAMIFLALLSVLRGRPMQQLLAKDARFRATELLLYERMPRVQSHVLESVAISPTVSLPSDEGHAFRTVIDPDGPTPQVHLLGNGRYHTMLSHAGSGYSLWNNIAVTRWSEDRTRDASGYFLYVRDADSGEIWSVGYQPTLKTANSYEVIFAEGRAEIRRTDGSLDTHLEIAVSPDDDAELRRITITNRGRTPRVLEVTTYAEVVMAPRLDDLAHPAFSNLFVETEILKNEEGILCRRRSRDGAKDEPWLFHAVVVHECASCNFGVETDRAEFVGRNRDLQDPIALSRPFASRSGAVLDPVLVIRKRVTIPPEGGAVVDCILGVAASRDGACDLVARFRERSIADRVFGLSWTHGHILLQQLNCSPAEAAAYGSLASALIYGGPFLRCEPALLKTNTRQRSAYWSYGISGDLPIVLLRIHSSDGIPLLRQGVKAHDYWRRKGLIVDLVVWNESPASYRNELSDRIAEVIAASSRQASIDKSGGIFVLRPEHLPSEDRVALLSGSRVILKEDAGLFSEQVDSARAAYPLMPKDLQRRVSPREAVSVSPEAIKGQTLALDFDNGYGGFATENNEYVIRIGPHQRPPLPWVNVIANAQFGTVVSESGSSYTWSENAREHRLTTWYNDAVMDPTGEALYLRDEDSGAVWCPTPRPVVSNLEYLVRHGFGYSTFTTSSLGINSQMTTFVAADSPIKVVLVRIFNHSRVPRRLTLTQYCELVLGDFRHRSAPQMLTEYDPTHGLIFGRHTFASDFTGRVAFLGSTGKIIGFTGDRLEFIGRNQSLAHPAALARAGLSDRVGAFYDPCLAMQVSCDIPSGSAREVAFYFGVGKTHNEARRLAHQYRSIARVHVALNDAKGVWQKLLSRITIKTIDAELNQLVNGWALYQTISSRLWGRSGFYQSGGAYGFRDQLQDVLAVVYVAPELVREHLLRCASRQFAEGDVQHWWHPPHGRGVRTTISDDLLWLPYVTAHYIKVTGDRRVLDEQVSFLSGRPLEPGQESDYDLPSIANDHGSLYEHCARAIEHGRGVGAHGLPLMGAGDWNDGMNRVGIHGQGESVWLGFFRIASLEAFATLAELRGETDRAASARVEVGVLRQSIDDTSWDGSWYIRAFFDDGTPLGTHNDQECRIDSLPQSWAVLASRDITPRSRIAVDSVCRLLVDRTHGIVKLLLPPFDHQGANPGYISGYLPGVRENGGQYTHAALWVIMALVRMGQPDEALKLLKLICPINHADTFAGASLYKVEPYVLAADVYAATSHIGRGGWTWYTGSSSWFYRTILEEFLGFDLRGSQLWIKPILPTSWLKCQIIYVYRDTRFIIDVCQTSARGKNTIMVDGQLVDEYVQLVDDHVDHRVLVEVVTTLC